MQSWKAMKYDRIDLVYINLNWGISEHLILLFYGARGSLEISILFF